MSDKRYSDFIARIKIINGKTYAGPLFSGEPVIVPVELEECAYHQGSLVRVERNSAGEYLCGELLAGPETALSKIYGILEKQKINPLFTRECHRETEKILESPGIDDPELADFTDLPFVTIDNEGSLDLDQALYLTEERGGYRIYYALADASYYIKPGMALFDEALKRGASYYLPGISVPMLPRELSEGVISLNPEVERRAVVFIMDLDENGEVVSTKVKRGRIRSRAKLTYSGVQEYYDRGEGSTLHNREFTGSLDFLKKTGSLLMKRAVERDVVRYNRFDENIGFSDDRRGFTIKHESRNDCSRYNEQMSLLCNIEGAKLISGDPGVQSIYRVHDAPAEEGLLRLKKVIEEIVDAHGLERETWLWKKGRESLADYLERIFTEGTQRNVCSAIERQILISNERSFYDENESGHYALGVELYSRFSSPMREIIGIFTHKELMEKFDLLEEEFTHEEDRLLRESIIESGNRSKDVQKNLDRSVRKLIVDQVFSGEINRSPAARRVYTGTILGIKSSRLYVRFHDLPVEVKVYVEELERHYSMKFHYVKDSVYLESDDRKIRFTIGAVITLKVHSYNEREKWILLPVEGSWR
jgi:ribonuclease R